MTSNQLVRCIIPIKALRYVYVTQVNRTDPGKTPQKAMSELGTHCLFTGISNWKYARSIKVRKVAKIRNRYNQVPHLTQDTTWESDKNAIKHHKQEPRSQPFPADDHKTAMNRRESMTNTSPVGLRSEREYFLNILFFIVSYMCKIRRI